MMLANHIMALLLGIIADCVVGDPYWFPHPVIYIGKWIGFLDKKLNLARTADSDSYDAAANTKRGALLVALVALPVLLITLGLTVLFYTLNPIAGVIYEAFMVCCCLAARSLYTESKKVETALRTAVIGEDHTLKDARYALSMIVGRDTASLDETGITKAVIETIAENCSDGIIAPLFWAVLFGPVGCMTYKAINTMDSMVGYKNDLFMNFGTAAARLDDVVNFIPARLTALFTVIFSLFVRDYDAKNAFEVFKRDRFNHSSPNSAQSESAFAGALGVALGGGASYFGVWHDKPVIGAGGRAPILNDIASAHVLMYGTLAVPAVLLAIVLVFV